MKHFIKSRNVFGTAISLLLCAMMTAGIVSCKTNTDDTDTPPAVTYYTVTFNTNGGTEVASQKVESGKKASKPTNPTKETTATETFVFDNWYTSTDGGTTLSDTAFDFGTAISSNITIYAKWNGCITLKDCSAIKKLFEKLCEWNSNQNKYNKTVTQFKKANAKPASAEHYLDASGNRIPLWYDETETTLYYYLEPGKKMSLRTSDNKNNLFAEMRKVTHIETSDFDTSNVTSMYFMFFNCSSLTTLDVSSFDTSNVTDMNSMFWDCSSLTTLDVSNFDTSNVTNMSGMFYVCSSLTRVDLSKFDTSKVSDMSGMFDECSSLTSLDLSKFDTSNVTDVDRMFKGCSSLTTIYASNNFATANVTNSQYMFIYCNNLKGGAGTVYNENHKDKEYARIDGGSSNPGYFTLKQ